MRIPDYVKVESAPLYKALEAADYLRNPPRARIPGVEYLELPAPTFAAHDARDRESYPDRKLSDH